jgi:hypothetical protein
MRNRAHFFVGILTLLGFVGTGVYLRLHVKELAEGPEAVRIAFRSNHIYLLMSGLVNLVMGVYSGPFDWRRWVRSAASVLVLAAPFVFGVAFAREPASGSFDRPLTRVGVVILAVGVVTHAICGSRRRREAA